MRRENSEAIRMVMEINDKGISEKGKPKKKWLNSIECDMKEDCLCIRT